MTFYGDGGRFQFELGTWVGDTYVTIEKFNATNEVASLRCDDVAQERAGDRIDLIKNNDAVQTSLLVDGIVYHV